MIRPPPVDATLSARDAAQRVWDALVVGAGPSGSIAARQLAREGASVLLVDRAAFPRAKVCGCCINAAALGCLRSLGLGDVGREQGGIRLDRFHLFAGGRSVALPMPAGLSMSRASFDAILIEHAVRSGAAFLPRTACADAGHRDPWRHALLRHGSDAHEARARLVLVADGVNGSFLRNDRSLRSRVSRGSHMGLSAIFPWNPGCGPYGPGTVSMAAARGGYVGIVRVDGGDLNVAAALCPQFLKRAGGPAPAVEQILGDAGAPPVGPVRAVSWKGAGLFTRRRRRLGAPRLLVLGDAAAFVEPFTGEGIAWALQSAVGLSPLALNAIDRWEPDAVDQWTQRYRRLVGRRQQVCWAVSRVLRCPGLMNHLVGLGRWNSSVAESLVRSICGKGWTSAPCGRDYGPRGDDYGSLRDRLWNHESHSW